jgi:hypothetical protein
VRICNYVLSVRNTTKDLNAKVLHKQSTVDQNRSCLSVTRFEVDSNVLVIRFCRLV